MDEALLAALHVPPTIDDFSLHAIQTAPIEPALQMLVSCVRDHYVRLHAVLSLLDQQCPTETLRSLTQAALVQATALDQTLADLVLRVLMDRFREATASASPTHAEGCHAETPADSRNE